MIHDEQLTTPPPSSPASPAGADQRRPWTRVVLLTILAAAVGASAWSLQARRRAAAGSAPAASAGSGRITPVLTAIAARKDIPVWLEGLGSVAAYYTVTVKTLVDGRVDQVLFTEGQHVKKGDVLVQIDPRPFSIQLESAQAALARDAANLKNARLNLDRYRTLGKQQLIAIQQVTDQESSVDQLDAQVRADQAQIDTSRLNLDYARIRSPIDGVTGVRLVDPGNIVHPADASGLVVVTQMQPITVLLTLPEDDLPAIRDAMTTDKGPLVVEALSRAGDRSLATGKLLVIDNEINQSTATVRLKAVFDNQDERLWPNQFVKARLRLSTRTGALVVPTAAVQHGPQGTFVYVVAPDSTAVVKPVTVDVTQGDVAIIASGLDVGEAVVVDGQAQLRPGARVAPAPAPSASSASSAPAARAAGPRETAGGPIPSAASVRAGAGHSP